MKKTVIFVSLFLVATVAFAVAWQLFRRVPEPDFTVIADHGNIQIRHYPEIIVAETLVEGERYAAINQGFRKLADFIFGGNSKKQKIAMTAPVMQVNQGDNVWLIRFVMPKEHTMETLPDPNNPDVAVRKLKAKKMIVVRFKGFNRDSNVIAHHEKLKQYVKEHDLKTTGEAIISFYNPPWTLPFLRRNEIMYELKE